MTVKYLLSKKMARAALLVMFAMLCLKSFAQDTLSYADPSSFVSSYAVGLAVAAFSTLFTFLAGFIPAIGKWKGQVRALAVSFVVVAAAATFKLGALNADTVELVFDTFLPNFAFSGAIWELLKLILGLAGVDIRKFNNTKK